MGRRALVAAALWLVANAPSGSPWASPPRRGLRPTRLRAKTDEKSAIEAWWTDLVGRGDKKHGPGTKATPPGDEDARLTTAPWAAELGSLRLRLANSTLPFLSGVGSGVVLCSALLLVPSARLDPAMRSALVLYQDVLTEIERAYVEELDVTKLTESALQAMLSNLDPYTNIQKSEELREAVQGRYGGVGLVISEPLRMTGPNDGGNIAAATPSITGKKSNGRGPRGSGAAGTSRTEDTSVVVLNAFEGYAFDSGMRVGDRIIAVDDTPVKGLGLDSVRDLLRGKPETQVRLHIARDVFHSGPSGEEMDITLDRRIIQVDDIRVATLWGRKEEGLAYVQIANFGADVARDLARSLLNLEAQAPKGLRGIVLDLRGNPGGLLSSAIETASLLVPKGSTIVTADGRAFNAVRYKSNIEPLRPMNLPLVVLTNSGTASAAEIVAGAVQDLDAGVVVGIGEGRTFGKGLVQEVEELDDGNSIKYTVAKYYTPSGRCIQSDTYANSAAKIKAKNPPLPASDTAPGAPVPGAKRPESDATSAPARPKQGFTSTRIQEEDKRTYQTRQGRSVRDGGGIEADVKVDSPPVLPLTQALISQGAFFDFASEWTRKHEFMSYADAGGNSVLREFQEFAKRREREGMLKLDALVPQLKEIEEGLKDAKLPNTVAEVQKLRSVLRKELTHGFQREESEVRVVLQEALSSRFLPESMLQTYRLEKDTQFSKGLELLRKPETYSAILQGPAGARK